MKDTKRQLIVLVILAAVGLAVYFGLRSYNANQKSTTVSDRNDLVSITGLTDLVFTGKDGAELRFSRPGADEAWVCENDPAWPLDQSKLERFENLLSGLYIVRSFDERDTLPAYGLEPAQGWISAENAQGEQVKVLLGKAAQDSGTYAMIEGTDRVVVIAGTLAQIMDTDLAGLAVDAESETEE